MAESKFKKYIRTDPAEIVFREIVKMNPEVTDPTLVLRGNEGFGMNNFSLYWVPITRPFKMIAQNHAHNNDQYLAFIGGDLTNMLDLGGEVELTLGEVGKDAETIVINRATLFYVPAGLMHGPLVFKKVNDPSKPILHCDLYLATEYLRKTKP